MSTNLPFFAGIAVDDLSKAKRFYGQTLGLDVSDRGTSLMTVHAANGYSVLLYEKPVHEPAAPAAGHGDQAGQADRVGPARRRHTDGRQARAR
jgi:hypothetical protein